MAKYLDSNGLSYFWAKLKAYFSAKSHVHNVSVTTGDSVTVTAGTAASLTTTNLSIPNISKKTVVTSVTPATVVTGGTKTAIPNISVTSKSIPNVTSIG